MGVARSPSAIDVDALVVQSGRELERAARALVPERRDPEGKPLTLGPRMYRLRDRLDDRAWAAFQAWAHERNAYVHGETDVIADVVAFRRNFELVRGALEALAEVPREGDAESIGPVVAVVVAVVLGLLYAC